MTRKTKIICTLGPAVDSDELVSKLIDNGMDCARFNFSHGTHAEHKARMERVRQISAEKGRDVALMLDTKGPEIRLKDFENGSVILEKGQTFTLDDDVKTLGNQKRVAISYGRLAESVKPGVSILIDDGKIGLEVVKADGGAIVCTVKNGGKISNHKSINIPNLDIPMDYISAADRADILFGAAEKVDYIAASFVRTARDVKELRQLLFENGGWNTKIISKIENRQGVDNIDRIIEVSDGIMVARGDLGVEIPFQDIPAIQKQIIEKCNIAGKIVVTATQMLESMTKSPRPTRAEVSDVANAVFDGTTVIMLSGESAAGDYPAEAVKTMADIALSTEQSINYNKTFVRDHMILERNIANTICAAAYSAAAYLHAKAIVVVTKSGKTASCISNFRPDCPIIAVTIDPQGRRQLSLEWGVMTIAAEHKNSADELFEYAREKAAQTGLVAEGDMIVVVTASDSQMAVVDDIIRICKM